MAALIIVEHNHRVIHPITRHVLAAAQLLTDHCVLMVIGNNCQTVAEEAAKIAGVSSVIMVDNPAYEHLLSENLSKVIAQVASDFEVILTSSSTFGKNLLPRVSALLDIAQVSDVIKIIDKCTFEHPIYAGNAIETVRVLDEKRLLTIRETAFQPELGTQPSCPIQSLTLEMTAEKSQWLNHQLNQSKRPELTQAKVIVSGGRGLQNKDNFHLIEQLADVLGGAVGASRAAVDAGFVPNDYQVGQTGKVVAPELYIAVGISGAIQHMAGMKDSKVIVAINKDPDAPMMQLATYSLVGDLFELVPQLIEKLKSLT